MAKGISFYGYNDGKAMTIYSCIHLFVPTVIFFVISMITTLLSIWFSNYCLLFVWIGPFILVLAYLLTICTTNYNDKVFLEGAKKKHSFVFKNNILFKDGKEIKNKGIKLYKFKKFLFIELARTYYRIPNDAFINIGREEFLSYIKYVPHSHRIRFIEKYKCPCCDFYTLTSYRAFEICPVCLWEDTSGIEDPNKYEEVNDMSLNEARKNYISFGACQKDLTKFVRKPTEYERKHL